jgi:hypothetical protein
VRPFNLSLSPPVPSKPPRTCGFTKMLTQKFFTPPLRVIVFFRRAKKKTVVVGASQSLSQQFTIIGGTKSFICHV